MEHHVRKQQANVATESENNKKPESEKLPPTEFPDVKTASMADLINAIKAGDLSIVNGLVELTQNLNQVCESLAQTQNRITNIEMLLEGQQLSNVSMLDKLAKVGSALVAFVAKFGTKKDAAEAKDEVEAEGDGKQGKE